MEAAERELAAGQLRRLADEIGLEMTDDQVERVVGMLESTVDGVRAGATLGLDGVAPAFAPTLEGGDEA